MVKKVVKKKKTVSKKKTSKKTVKKPVLKRTKISRDDTRIERVLIENFVGLQKVMVNLSVNFDNLSTKISKLLELFEISARALAEKDLTVEKTARDDTKILQEMGNLSEQNKVIARGLTLMHNRLSGEPEQPMERLPQMNPPMPPRNPPMPPRNPPMQKPAQRTAQQPMTESGNKVTPNKSSMEGYQKSIVSEPFKKLPT